MADKKEAQLNEYQMFEFLSKKENKYKKYLVHYKGS